MNPLDIAAAQREPLVCRFFRSFFWRRKLRVFLCGPEEGDIYHDLRHQLRGALRNRMGCEAFLGEQIANLKIKTRKDDLSIEVAEALQSQLIIVFLGSPGTISELTAFAMDSAINPRLLVFNDAKYLGKETFLNRGPLRLLRDEQLVHFDPAGPSSAAEIIDHVDFAVAREWFNLYGAKMLKDFGSFYLAGDDFSFEDFITLCTIYASYPVRWEHLTNLLPILKGKKRTGLQERLKRLFELGLIKTVDKRYLPEFSLEDLRLPTGIVTDVSKARMRVLGKKLQTPEGVDDSRILF